MPPPLRPRIWLLCAFSLCALATIAGEKPKESKKAATVPSYVIQRAKSKILVDGKINEDGWRKAKGVGDFVFGYLKEKTGKEEQTSFKILWDDEYLYFAVVCEDRSLLSLHTDRDGRIPEDDSVEIYITPNPKKPERHFAFYVNIHAALYDEKFDAKGGRIPKKNFDTTATARKQSWDSTGVKVKATFDGTLNNHKDTDRSWSLEIAVPFANFADAAVRLPPKPNDVWKLNPNRHAYNPDGSCHYSQWAPTIATTGSFWGPELFGEVIFAADPPR